MFVHSFSFIRPVRATPTRLPCPVLFPHNAHKSLVIPQILTKQTENAQKNYHLTQFLFSVGVEGKSGWYLEGKSKAESILFDKIALNKVSCNLNSKVFLSILVWDQNKILLHIYKIYLFCTFFWSFSKVLKNGNKKHKIETHNSQYHH